VSRPPEPTAAPVPAPALPAWLIPALIAALATCQIATFRWGVIMPDAVVQYGQALSGDYGDWHPPVMAWLWRWLGAARFGSAPMLLLQVSLYWLGLGLIADGLRRAWPERRWWPLLPILIGALPIPFGQLAAVLKDSQLAACLLAASGIAIWHALQGRTMRWPARVAIAVLVVIAAAARFNAPFAGAPVLLLALPRPPRGPICMIVAALPAIALLFATAVLINQLMLQPRAQRPMLSLVNFDLAGISLRSGTNVYPPAARPTMVLLARCYSPASFNPHYAADCDTVEGGLHQRYDAQGGALPVWLGAIAHHPLAYARHRLAHFNVNQRFAVAHVPDDAVFIATTPNDLGLFFKAGPATLGIYHVATWLAWSPLGRPATWLVVALGVLLCTGSVPARLLALSALLYGAGYAMVSVAPDLRYNLWTLLAAMLALLIGWDTMSPRQRLFGVALPAGFAMMAELIALFTA